MLVKYSFDGIGIGDVFFVEGGEDIEVVDGAGGEVIDDDDLMSLFYDGISEMRSYEPRSACNENFHVSAFC